MSRDLNRNYATVSPMDMLYQLMPMNYRENAPLEEIDLSLYQTENPPSAHYPTHPEHFRTNIVIFARLPQIIFIRTF